MLKEHLESLAGQHVAIKCDKYLYRGNVKKVGDDSVILEKAALVEVFGNLDGDSTEREMECPSDMLISFFKIEMVCQPSWEL